MSKKIQMRLVNIAVNDFGAKKSARHSLEATVLTLECFVVTELIVTLALTRRPPFPMKFLSSGKIMKQFYILPRREQKLSFEVL